MKEATQVKCSCAHCGHVIEYSATAVGDIVECPKCRQKSQLPPAAEVSEEIQTSKRARTPAKLSPGKLALIAGLGLLAVGGLALLPLLRQRRTEPVVTVQAPAAVLPQPKVKSPKSLNDLKIGKFSLQEERGSNLRIVVGDIENDSENVHRDIKVELELRDGQGQKVDTLAAFVKQLGPHATWQVLGKTTNTRAVSVRVVGLKEEL